MNFDEQIAQISEILRSRATQQATAQAQTQRDRLSEASARFGFGGGTPLSVSSQLEAQQGEALRQANENAMLFQAQANAGELSKTTEFERQRQFAGEQQQRRLDILQQQLAAQRQQSKSALFGQIAGTLGGIGGGLLAGPAGAGLGSAFANMFTTSPNPNISQTINPKRPS